MYKNNLAEIQLLCGVFKKTFKNKTIWLYSGYKWEELLNHRMYLSILENIDVLVDGRFERDKLDINYPFAGSTNQRIIDVQKSLKENKVIIYELK